MDDPFGLMKFNYVLIFMIFNPLVFLLSSAGSVPSSNIRVISSIPLFYFFVLSSPSSCFPLSIVYLSRLYLCLLFLDPRLLNTFSSARGSGEHFVPICLCHGQKGTGSAFFVRVLRFSPPNIISPMPHTHSLITDAI